jgi:hypothetical protein
VPYDAGKDLDLLTVAVQAPNVLVVPAASPFKSVADVIAALKKTPEKMLRLLGQRLVDHLTAELFWQQTGTSGIHALQGRRAGHQRPARRAGRRLVPEHQRDPPARQRRQAARPGRHRREALGAAARRADAGRSGREGCRRLFLAGHRAPGPAGGREGQAARGHRCRAQRPGRAPKLLEVGFEIVANTPEQFAAFQAAESARWKQLIETRKITAD